MKKILDVGYHIYMLGLLGLFIFLIIGVTGCECGCAEQDSNTLVEELTKTGKVLRGKHYLKIIPGTDQYVEIEDSRVNMFINFDETSVVRTFAMYEVEFGETTDEPYVMFKWAQNTYDRTINEMLSRDITMVYLFTPPGMLEKKNPFVEGIDKGLHGEQTDEYVKSLIEGTNQ